MATGVKYPTTKNITNTETDQDPAPDDLGPEQLGMNTALVSRHGQHWMNTRG